MIGAGSRLADNGVTLVGPLFWHGRLPAVAEDGEEVVGEPVSAVVAAVHDEFYGGGNGAELADDEPVADEDDLCSLTTIAYSLPMARMAWFM